MRTRRLATQGKLRAWAVDESSELEFRINEYWSYLSHMPFYEDLDLKDPESTIPISWHCDGVKVFKTHKCWVYSFSSCIRKGPSLDTKLLFLDIRDTLLVKPPTHDAVGKLIGYCMDVLMTGNFPQKDYEGRDFPADSLEARRAGLPFASGFKAAFAAFKADLEARVMIHKLVRNWSADSICEHYLASKLPNGFNYGDFSNNAAYFECLFSHSEFLWLNPPTKQSSWVHV